MNAQEPGSCDVCKTPRTADELVSIGGKNVCADCKPDVVLDLKSGVKGTARVSAQEADRIKRRITKLNLLSFAFALPGIGLQFLGGFAIAGTQNPHDAQVTLMLLRVLGAPLIIAGLVCYALMKGRSGVLGLLGLLSCLGLLILHFLPKNCQHCKKSASYRAKTCADCGAPV